jgi:DNA polymerase III subunit delta
LPIIILAGEEEFRISREAQALKKRLVDPSWASFNFQRFGSADLKQVIDAAATVPFGPGNKMVLFEDCALFTKKRGAKDKDDDSSASAKDKSPKLLDDLEAALNSVPANTYLVFSCVANFDSTLKVSKIFAKHAEISKFDKVKYYAGAANRELLDFCNREAKLFDACIDDDAACYLAESTEADLRQISSEIQKAAVYILPEKTVRLEHVTLLSPHFSHVFALMEHWAAGRKQEVLSSIKELQSRQVSPHMVIAAAQTVLSKWVGYKTEVEKACAVPGGSRDVRRREVPLNEVARRIAFEPRMAFIVEQDLKRIRNVSLEYLVQKKVSLTDLEFLLKSGQMPEGHALEHFFTR